MRFDEVFACNSMGTINFFFQHLKDKAGCMPVSMDETKYTASVLAHYSHISRGSSADLPPFASLSEVYDNFIHSNMAIADSELMEYAGSQSLLLAGFFRDQMRYRGRHNVHWYDQMGRSFYARAAFYSRGRRREQIMEMMSANFQIWTQICCGLSRTFRDMPYLLRLPPADSLPS